MYKETLPQSSSAAPNHTSPPLASPESSSIDGKVNRICQAFIKVLQSKMDTNLKNVITAQVCQVPPNIEAALAVVRDLRSNQPEQAETAVEHICFLADVNQVYDTALGMYDVDLALLVAQQSQKVSVS